MARTYLSTNNSRGKEVTAMSPTHAHIRGWDAGVKVLADISSPTHDEFHVYMTTGSNGGGRGVHVGSVVQGEDGPVWVPAPTHGEGEAA